MNRISIFAVAAAFSSLAFAGVSNAADSGKMNWGPELEHTLTTFNSNFDVKYVGDASDEYAGSDADDKLTGRTPDGVEHIAAAVRSNKPLVKRLEEKGIDPKDIVNAEQAADGSVTFYLR